MATVARPTLTMARQYTSHKRKMFKTRRKYPAASAGSEMRHELADADFARAANLIETTAGVAAAVVHIEQKLASGPRNVMQDEYEPHTSQAAEFE